MSRFAAVVLAHADPEHLHRLVDALDGVPMVVHVDARTPDNVHARMTEGLPTRARLLPRRATSLASWSLVDAEVRGVRAALEHSDVSHVAILSGADYPLAPPSVIGAELDRWGERSLLWNAPIPFSPWDTPRHRDGGLRRSRHRYVLRHDQVLHLGRYPLRWPGSRRAPEGLELRACSQWKIYWRGDAQRLLHAMDAHPRLMQFWRGTHVPEESFVASVLASRAFVDGEPLRPCGVQPWYFEWTQARPDHPSWLTLEHADRVLAAARAPSASPEEALTWPPSGPRPDHRKLFARKLCSDWSAGLLARIDAELLGR